MPSEGNGTLLQCRTRMSPQRVEDARERALGSSGLRLLPNDLSQRLIDPVLPARPGFLKVIKNVPVNSQRDKLLGIRDSRTLRRKFRRLRGYRLERRFNRIP